MSPDSEVEVAMSVCVRFIINQIDGRRRQQKTHKEIMNYST